MLVISVISGGELWAEDFRVPSLSLTTLNGGTDSLSSYRGRIVVLNFWATWCVPCQNEMPLLVDLHRKYATSGVQFIGVTTEGANTEERESVAEFVKDYAVNFPIWIGATPDHQFSFRLATAVPATIIIDRNGIGVFRIIGESTRTDLTRRLDFLLSENKGSIPKELVLPESITPEHFREHELGLEEDEEHTEQADAGESEVPS